MQREETMFSKIKILGVFFLLIVLGGNTLSFAAQDRQEGKIFVNGTELEGESAWFISEEYESNDGCRRSTQVYETAEVPFTAILKAYGFEVEWLDDQYASLTFKDKVYKLDLEKIEVIDQETGENWLEFAPGERGSYTVAKRELYLDQVNTKCFLYLIDDMREGIFIEGDKEALRVDVTF